MREAPPRPGGTGGPSSSYEQEQLAKSCYLMVERLGVELRLLDCRSNALTITPPSHARTARPIHFTEKFFTTH